LEQKISDLENRSFFAHFCSFAKSDKKSDPLFALFKRANEQTIAQSLF